MRPGPLYPGTQRSLIVSLNARYWGSWTDWDGDPHQLNATRRQLARRESHPTTEGLPSHVDAGHKSCCQRSPVACGLTVERFISSVPASLSRRSLTGLATQDAALGTLSRAGMEGAPQGANSPYACVTAGRDQGAIRLL